LVKDFTLLSLNSELGKTPTYIIKNKIEDNLQYPGTIKVVLIRETRVIEEAK